MGPLGFGVLPSVKTFLREVLMTKFLTELYNKELEGMRKSGGIKTWSAGETRA